MGKEVLVVLLLLVVVGCSQEQVDVADANFSAEAENANSQASYQIPPPQAEDIREQELSLPEQIPETKKAESVWSYGGVAVAGTYADADVVGLEDGRFRMYYSEEPEVPGFRGKVFSAVSEDGREWEKEEGVRREFSTFPDVVRLGDGRFRMYFQNMGVIKSAVSNDGLSWMDEPGVRIDVLNDEGLRLELVAAPTTLKTEDGYVMVYSGVIKEKYPEEVPNQDTHLFLWATSEDGVKFEKKGIALDSRNAEFKGWLDGPELVKWDDGVVRLYFWSYKGIYHVTFENSVFSGVEFDYTTNTDTIVPFPENPPSDPTLARINNMWFLYYGQHTKGIHYATLGGH